MRKCARCGRNYNAGESFCASCGSALSEAQPVGPSSATTAPASFDLRRAGRKIVLMVAVLNIVAFSVFSCGVFWMMFKTVQTTLHDEALNQLLILADGMGTRAANYLQIGDMNGLQQLQQEAMAHPEIAYSFIRDADGRILTSTFEGNIVPDALKNINELGKGVPFGTEETSLAFGDMALHIVDVGAALSGESKGSLHMGWRAEIQRNGLRQMFFPVIAFAVGLLIILIGVLVSSTSVLTGRILRMAG